MDPIEHQGLIPKRTLPNSRQHIARQELNFGDATGYGRIAGEYFSLKEGTDIAPLLKGLEADLCQSPHWGLKARSLTVRPKTCMSQNLEQASGRFLICCDAPQRSQQEEVECGSVKESGPNGAGSGAMSDQRSLSSMFRG